MRQPVIVLQDREDCLLVPMKPKHLYLYDEKQHKKCHLENQAALIVDWSFSLQSQHPHKPSERQVLAIGDHRVLTIDRLGDCIDTLSCIYKSNFSWIGYDDA